ncbi:neutral/alkaline non-lysosomal ceramidase N-terminal domain-containing protein [Flocculibacter collagenilyticus]|uniref:neutral/alkaline non-lysosomal ceramidase N-terminal domain-containing protein n=1 Tax=Flocculibacter collagenilyticus TaxID=2744479 RepID=UPI0018F62D05|nr:neutral/alkaline non-lysosomal ceramidase N-terminal domain-containing protein [Flocculibacter collagenilyticus]
MKKNKSLLSATRLIKSALLLFITVGPTTTLAGEWLIGSAKYDITGPAADAGMVGYGEVSQTTQGIHTRLWSRAFVIADKTNSKRVVFVSADLQSITQGVKQGVIKKLQAQFGSRYNDENVMLTATHTHVGPGGYDHYVMLNMSALGYDSKNYQAIVDGIYDSIVAADSKLAPGNILIENGLLTDASINRNPVPYGQNPEATDYLHKTNKNMTVLKLVTDNNQEIGMINWFAVHNVSFGMSQRQLSSDNKGIASQLFEKWTKSRNSASNDFVGAFANSNLGDASPNVCGPSDGCGANNEESALLSATKQFNKAKSLYEAASAPLNGSLDYRHQYVYMPDYQVNANFTGGIQQGVCEGAIGWSMTAGSTWDGPTNIPGIFEGMTTINEGQSWDRSQNLFDSVISGYPIFGLMNAFSSISLFNEAQDDPCQHPKPTFLNRKTLGIELYTAHLPFQMFRIGSLLIVSSAGEMTTMSGRRLINTLTTKFAEHGIDQVVIAGLANAYHGYVTTPEEFQMQYYEGGHTIYGPNTLPAYQQIYSNMADAMLQNQSVPSGPTPPDLSDDQIIPVLGVVYDDKRLWESFGQVTKNARNQYTIGEEVKVTFRSGHPRNNLQIGGSFIDVQRKVNGNWVTWLTDDDIDTKFIWRRDTAVDCLACSFADGVWRPSASTPEGTYRIVHRGHWKSGWDRRIRSYTGKSKAFTVVKP